MTDVNNFLEHYGVKGMKWGVRRKSTGATSEDHDSSRTSKKKALSTMSNAEIRRLNERLQLEQSNKALQSRGALQKIKTGTAIAGTILAVGATVNTAINFANSPTGKLIASAIGKKARNPDWLF